MQKVHCVTIYYNKKVRVLTFENVFFFLFVPKTKLQAVMWSLLIITSSKKVRSSVKTLHLFVVELP